MKIHLINKKIGETPLGALENFRKKSKLPITAKLTYAGRLDPMANGLLLILEGATQKDREKYMALPKVYKAKVLFGFSTDSFDLLGIPLTNPNTNKLTKLFNQTQILKILKSFTGKVTLPVPPFSSVPYKGKSLFELAKTGKITWNNTPKRKMTIKNIKLLKIQNKPAPVLLKYIQDNISKVQGDFRQTKILKAWHKLLINKKNKFQTLEIQISCLSGTYIRSIANQLGKKLKTTSLLFSLERLSIGKYKKML